MLLSRACQAAFYNAPDFANETSRYVNEYIQRKRLAALGFVSNLDGISSYKADIFLSIDVIFERLKARKPGGK